MPAVWRAHGLMVIVLRCPRRGRAYPRRLGLGVRSGF